MRNLLVLKLEIEAIVLSVDGLKRFFAILCCVMVRSNHIGLQGWTNSFGLVSQIGLLSLLTDVPFCFFKVFLQLEQVIL